MHNQSITNEAVEHLTLAAAQSQEKSRIGRMSVAAAVAGNALEFYDFVIYAYFAVYIGHAFFPVSGEYGSLLLSAATFGVGFFTRPLGAILIGTLADRAGRKPAMILTVVLITIGTLGMAATPTYESIGVAAPIIVVTCRLLQGLALGGEVGPATALLIEAAPPGKRAFYASWQVASQGLAVAVGGGIGVAISLCLSPEQMADWGWRVPFLLSLLLVPVAFYLRRRLPETLKSEGTRSTSEVLSGVWYEHRRVLLLGILVCFVASVATQLGNFMTTYALKTLHLPASVAQSSALIGGVMTFVSALFAGWLCDRYGRKRVLIIPLVLLIILVVPMFHWLLNAPSAERLLLVTAVLASLTCMVASTTLVVIPELMPIASRSTGTSLVYATSSTLFGGSAQFVITVLLATTNQPVSPAWYVVTAGIISMFAMWRLPETRLHNIHQ